MKLKNFNINILASVVMMFAVMVLAVDKAVVITKPPVKPPVVIDKEALIVQRIAVIQSEKAKLSTTVYSGTMTQVLTARVADVNAVHVKAKGIIEDANAVLLEKGIVTGKRERIVSILAADSEKIKEQKQNAEFIKNVTEILDPVNLDPNDPNYITDMEQYSELTKWCIEVIKPI